MSAFICKERTFKDISGGFKTFENSRFWSTRAAISEFMEYIKGTNQEEDIYDMAISHLYSLNVRAVNQRYGRNIDDVLNSEDLIKFSEYLPISAIRFLKALECLHYQMSEGDVVNQAGYFLIEKLICAVAKDIIHTSDEYEKAKWE